MDPSRYKSKDPDDYESSNIQLICDLKVCMFCLLQISDAEKILGIVQSEVLVVMAEAYDVALEISPGKNDYNSFILHKNNNAHFQTTELWTPCETAYFTHSWSLRGVWAVSYDVAVVITSLSFLLQRVV